MAGNRIFILLIAMLGFCWQSRLVAQTGVGTGVQELSIFSNSGKSAYPMFTADPSQVCAGMKFYDAMGILQIGTAICDTAKPDCTVDGASGCLTTRVFKAADSTKVVAGAILVGAACAGVAGTAVLPDTENVLSGTTYGASGTGSIGSLVLPSASAVRVVSGPYGIAGAGLTPTLADCAADGAVGCVTNTGFPSAKITNFSAGDVRSGVQVAGVTGSLMGIPVDCSSDAATGCMATPAYSAAATNGLAAKILSGNTVAGVAGSVLLPNAGNVYNGVVYGIAGSPLTGTLTLPSSSKVRTSSSAYGVAGALTTPMLADCSVDGALGCVAVAAYPSAKLAGFAGSDIRTGTTIAGVAGSLDNCAADGGTNCVATTSFTAAATSGLTGKVLAGSTVAGVNGDVSLPATGDVFDASSYGASGTSLTGTLTLPFPANVWAGNGAYGASGNGSVPTLASCTLDGAFGCVTVTGYPAAKLANFSGIDIQDGKTIAGVAGTIANCTVDGGTSCLVSALYGAAATAGLASKVVSGNTVAGVAGNVTLPPVGDVFSGVSYGASGTASIGTLTLPVAANVWTTNGVYGVDGSSSTPVLGSCTTDGSLGCVTVTGYPSAKLANFSAANIELGTTIAGIAGSITNCVADGSIGCWATGAYTAAATSGLASKVISGNSVAGVAGTVVLPSAGTVLSGVSFGGSGTTNSGTLTIPAAANVRAGNGAYGVGGTGTSPALPDCAADGAAGCVAVGPAYAAALTTGIAAEILVGGTVAGIPGNATLPAVSKVISTATYGASGTSLTGTVILPPAGNVLASTTYGGAGTAVIGTLKLPTAANVRSGNGSFGVGGNGTTPTLNDCGSDGTLGCVTVAGYPAARLANFAANNLLSGFTAAGIAGTLANCTGDGATGCIAVVSFKAANMSAAIPANIAAGVTMAGVVGSALSSTPCASDGQQNCAVSGSLFAGNISGISTWDLRAGKTLGGIAGALKTNCRNTVNSAYYNWDGAVTSLPNSAQSSGTAFNYWDTIDDYNGFPPNLVTAWSAATLCDSSTWTDVTTADGGTTLSTCAASPSSCQFQDKITNLTVTGTIGTGLTWNASIQACAASTYGGYAAGTWRLPTQKELISLYTDGIVALASTSFISLSTMQTNYFWSASSFSNGTVDASYVQLAGGLDSFSGKSTSHYALCVK